MSTITAPGFEFKRRCKALLLTAVLSSSLAINVNANELDRTSEFNIPAQSLDAALVAFSEQADIQLAVQTDIVDGFETQDLRGEHSARAALSKLLNDTGLTFKSVEKDTVAVSKTNGDQSMGKSQPASRQILIAQAGTPAQQSQTTATSSTDSGAGKIEAGRNSIEEIIVSARKRDERLQDVPLTMTVVDASFLKITGVSDMQELQQHVPALTISSNTNAFTAGIRLRGIGTAGNETSYEPGVGFFVDGVYQSKSGLGMSDLTDIERIEILYGPQSTLYGKSTNAGVINVITKAPTAEFEGDLEVSAGDFGLFDGRFSVSGPVSEGVAYRFSGRAHVQDGFLQDLDPAGGGGDLNDVDDQFLRGQLLFTPNDRLDIRLIASYTKRDQNCCSAELDAGPVHVGTAFVFGIPQAPLNASDRVVSLDYPVTFIQDSTDVSATINYNHDAFTLTSITAYNQHDWEGKQDTDFSSIDWWQLKSKRNQGESWSQEIRIASETDGRFDWLGGVYYDTFDFEREGPGSTPLTLGVIPGFVLPAVLPPPLTAAAGDTAEVSYKWGQESIAAFGQVGYAFTDKLTVSAGLRFKHEEKDARFIQTPITASPFSIMALAILPPLDEDLKREEDSVTWMASARYFWSDETMTFISVATGEKSGGFTVAPGLAVTSSQREYDEEKTINYELGIKSQQLSNRLQLTASLFYTEIEDFQNQTFEATSGAFVIDNAPLQTSRGVDIETLAIIANWFTLEAAFEVLDAQYDDFPKGPCYLGRPDSYQNTCDVSGEDLPWAPEWSATVAASFVWPIGENRLYARIDYSYTGDHVAADDLDPLAAQSYDLLNLRAGIRGQRRANNWDAAIWVKNATDETYFLQSVGVPLFPGSFMQWLNPPRTWGVTLSYEF